MIQQPILQPKRQGLEDTPTSPLQRRKTPLNECPGYKTKQSDGDAPVMDVWGIWITSLLLLLPGKLGPGVEASERVLSMGYIELFDISTLSK